MSTDSPAPATPPPPPPLAPPPPPPLVPPPGSGILYFAYGADMHMGYMARQCPNSRYIGRAELGGFRWHINALGRADLVASPRAHVPGLVFEIPDDDFARFDGDRFPRFTVDTVDVDLMPAPFCLYRRPAAWIAQRGGPETVLNEAVASGRSNDVRSPHPLKNVRVFRSDVGAADSRPDRSYAELLWLGANDAMALGVDMVFFQRTMARFFPGRTLPHMRIVHHRTSVWRPARKPLPAAATGPEGAGKAPDEEARATRSKDGTPRPRHVPYPLPPDSPESKSLPDVTLAGGGGGGGESIDDDADATLASLFKSQSAERNPLYLTWNDHARKTEADERALAAATAAVAQGKPSPLERLFTGGPEAADDAAKAAKAVAGTGRRDADSPSPILSSSAGRAILHRHGSKEDASGDEDADEAAAAADDDAAKAVAGTPPSPRAAPPSTPHQATQRRVTNTHESTDRMAGRWVDRVVEDEESEEEKEDEEEEEKADEEEEEEEEEEDEEEEEEEEEDEEEDDDDDDDDDDDGAPRPPTRYELFLQRAAKEKYFAGRSWLPQAQATAAAAPARKTKPKKTKAAPAGKAPGGAAAEEAAAAERQRRLSL